MECCFTSNPWEKAHSTTFPFHWQRESLHVHWLNFCMFWAKRAPDSWDLDSGQWGRFRFRTSPFLELKSPYLPFCPHRDSHFLTVEFFEFTSPLHPHKVWFKFSFAHPSLTRNLWRELNKKMTVRGTMVRSEVCNSWCFCLGSYI